MRERETERGEEKRVWFWLKTAKAQPVPLKPGLPPGKCISEEEGRMKGREEQEGEEGEEEER